MKKKPFVYLFLALVIAFGACNEPVFYIISVVPAITDPLIDGSPTNFVVLNRKMYVATGRKIFRYDGTNWELMPSQPGGRIMQLAATDNYLYALCFQDTENKSYIKRFSSQGVWEEVTGDTGGYNIFQSVYAAGNKVFIGAEKNSYFIILYMSDSDDGEFKPLTQGGISDAPEYMLCGIAYDSVNYYLCTRGSTIYSVPKTGEPLAAVPKEVDGAVFTGIINLEINDIIAAISRKGNLYNVSSAGITEIPGISFGDDRPSTGALAIWKDTEGAPRLLLAGRQDKLDYTVNSGYTYGYMELELDSTSTTGIIAERNFVEPGKESPSSVADYERYTSTIGKCPVNHIFQIPADIDEDMTLFASTQKNGVWSLRRRDDDGKLDINSELIWNSEE